MSVALFVQRVRELAEAGCEFTTSQGIDGIVLCVLISDHPNWRGFDLLQSAALGAEAMLRGPSYHEQPRPEAIKQLLDLNYEQYTKCYRAVRAMDLGEQKYHRRLRQDLLDIIGFEEVQE